MNNLNKDDEDMSACVHAFVRSVAAYGAKNEFLAGPYRCPDNNGETTTLYGLVGTDII